MLTSAEIEEIIKKMDNTISEEGYEKTSGFRDENDFDYMNLGKILYTNLSLNKMLYNDSSKIAIIGLCDKY